MANRRANGLFTGNLPPYGYLIDPSVSLTPPSFGHLPYILLCKTPRNATGHGRGGDVFSFRFCSDFIRDTL